MTIIIETPQPPIRERLVLVREGEPMAPRRDAEPADLERAGWVEEHLLVTARAEMRELGSERDEARAERDKLEAKLEQAEKRGDLADQRAIDAIAERDEVRRQRDAEIASRDALARVLEQVERERDEARCLYEAAHCERMRITDVLQRVERERDEARAALAKMQEEDRDATAVERARCVADLRAEAERIRSCTGGAGWAPGTAAAVAAYLDIAADRLERGDHAGTPVPAALPRATDEELFAAYQTAYIVSCGVKDPSEDQRSITRVMPAERKGIAAVAARVRREQCLVTRAVEAGVKVTITRTSERMPGCCVGLWDVRVTRRPDAPGEYYSHGVPAADVPATLARLLGEVTRGR